MNKKGFVKYIVIVIVILVVVFLSQQRQMLGGVVEQAQAYIAGGSDWVRTNLLSNISGEVQKRGEMVREGVEEEKEKITQSVGEKIKNYFSGITDSILHPGENNCDCQSQPIQSSPEAQ